jgi:hypothetical protein
MVRLKEWIKDRYLTWRTGKDKRQRDHDEWYTNTVNYHARDITDMFKNFKHVIIVNPDLFLDLSYPFGWVPVQDARQYFYPVRQLTETCVWRFERVSWNQWDSRWHLWHLDEIGGEDKVFVACNSDEDAVMLALKYA